MSLELRAAVPERGFELELAVADGETVAVLGPNGAGKSTMLTLIAGLLRPGAGRAVLDGRVLFDVTDGGRGRWLPPHSRGVSMLAQDALLFPHLSALDNVAFGPRSSGVARSEADRRARDWLDRVDALELADRRPAQLSGGQAQRIAVARALASDPGLLLLDEPMAALDVSVAPALRRTLRDVLADRSVIIVTHDVLDAFTLADRVVVLEGGRIVDAGPTRKVLERPTTPFAAGLAALNLLTGIRTATGIETDSGHSVRADAAEPMALGARAGLSIRPSLVTVATAEPSVDGVRGTRGASDLNTLAGVVSDLEPRGDVIRVRTSELSADVPPGVVASLDLAPGTRVWCSFRPEDAVAYPL